MAGSPGAPCWLLAGLLLLASGCVRGAAAAVLTGTFYSNTNLSDIVWTTASPSLGSPDYANALAPVTLPGGGYRYSTSSQTTSASNRMAAWAVTGVQGTGPGGVWGPSVDVSTDPIDLSSSSDQHFYGRQVTASANISGWTMTTVCSLSADLIFNTTASTVALTVRLYCLSTFAKLGVANDPEITGFDGIK
jgi:hypothetical protein